MNLLFKLSHLNSNFVLTLGYLNPALNNPVLMDSILTSEQEAFSLTLKH